MSSQRRVEALLALAVVVLVVALAWSHRWMSDDGFINLRIVRQLRSGHGPVFNAGERIEASTSPMWVALLALADLLFPGRLESITVFLGVGFTATAFATAIAASQLLVRRARPGALLLPVGALSLAVLTPIWDFATAGLEGSLALAWLGTVFLSLVRWSHRSERRVGSLLAVLVGLGPLIRPELTLSSLAFLLVLLAGGDRTWRGRLRVLALVGALPVAYQVFRMGYYGALLPNTYYAKEGGRAWWDQGWYYLKDFVGPYWLWVPALLLAGGALVPLLAELWRAEDRRALAIAIAFPAAGLVQGLAVVRFGGDFMHARLFVPVVFSVVAPVAVIPVMRTRFLSFVTVAWAAVCLVHLRPPPLPAQVFDRSVTDLRAFSVLVAGNRHPMAVSDFGYGPAGPVTVHFDGIHHLYLGQRPLDEQGSPLPGVRGLPKRVVISYGVGAIGFSVGPRAYVLDSLGLGDSLTAHLRISGRGRRPGHEKVLPPAWIWARLVRGSVRPDRTLLSVPSVLVRDAATHPASTRPNDFAASVAAARAALGCGTLRDARRAVEDPLTPKRFGQNLVAAVRRFSFRVPADPIEARRELC